MELFINEQQYLTDADTNYAFSTTNQMMSKAGHAIS